MPGYEVIGFEEEAEILSIFRTGGGVLFRNGFDAKRLNSWKSRDFENNFAQKMNVSEAVAVSSGTAAIRVALAALNIGDGDEVITQSFTFVATVEAIIESGAKPVCADIDATLNLDPDSLLSHINKNTRAVILVHMLGTCGDINRIKKICEENSLYLIEDTAWGCGSKFGDKYLGTFGDVGCFSFDYAKTITTGEGGMVISDNKEIIRKAREYHDHGHENNPNFPRWEDTRSSAGFNFRISELQSAVGLAQLRKLDDIVKLQRENAQLIIKSIMKFDSLEITKRKSFQENMETFDAVVFNSSKLSASVIRNYLLKFSISTKILPEATTWHFAGDWEHLNFVKQARKIDPNYLEKSRNILSKHFAIPNFVNLPDSFIENLESAFSEISGNSDA